MQKILPQKLEKLRLKTKQLRISIPQKKGGNVIERFIDQTKQSSLTNILHKAGTQVGTPFESNGVNRIEINGRIYELKKVEGKQKGNVEENEIFINYIFEDVTDFTKHWSCAKYYFRYRARCCNSINYHSTSIQKRLTF